MIIRKNKELKDLFSKKLMLIDGAMGTVIAEYNLKLKDFGQEKFAGCNEYLTLTKPEVILDIHKRYINAGADIIETNSFGATPLVLGEYGLAEQAYFIAFSTAKMARDVATAYSTRLKPILVAGSMGPSTKSLFVTGGISFEELAQNFAVQAEALILGGADYLFLETMMDTLNIKAGFKGIKDAFAKVGYEIPIAISVTIEGNGRMLAGQDVEAMYAAIEHIKPLYIGLNCAVGPKDMKEHIKKLSLISEFPVSLVPNAGMPDEEGKYKLNPKKFGTEVLEFVEEGLVNVIGGCCGTTPEHIKALAQFLDKKPRRIKSKKYFYLSGINALKFEVKKQPYLIGERANVIGSRLFKDVIFAEKFEEAVSIAKKQISEGAGIIDVCLTNPDRNEVEDLKKFLELATKSIKEPLMIDSRNPKAVRAAFELLQGKAILNSVNLEEQGKNLAELLPLVKIYGAAVVASLIEKEMPISAKEKIKIAKKMYKILTQKYQIEPKNIIFDPLVFPIATGDVKYKKAGLETLKAVEQLKKLFPEAKTVLGVSNISFGLPIQSRALVNSVYFYLAKEKGLDMAIINAEKLIFLRKISKKEKKLCEDLLLNKAKKNYDPVQNFINYFKDKKPIMISEKLESKLNAKQKLEQNVVQGSADKLYENLEEVLKEQKAFDIINGSLIAAMNVVGKKFKNNELIVTEVLRSAEIMKKAIDYLQKQISRTKVESRGKLLLATVKGDVHDIGKNLVSIIFSSNGYEVIDIGINVDRKTIIAEYKKHKPEFIGLSGLLVKSAYEMACLAKELAENNISVPLFLGGAALSEKFVEMNVKPNYKGEVVFCRDVLMGLERMNGFMKEARVREGKK